jgi:prepilin-type N-terminal cleavage/methylation domain-containing protein/prepilin-type processing-associated H-X9-DG protein
MCPAAGRRHGFTLIELLVVIAIIGILAAMLFPVFARARESARKIQCLSNVKNIAMAMQMYLADYDSFPPKESRAGITDAYACASDKAEGDPGIRAAWANPYLRWPVVLDEYVKNRDVWRCPSATYTVPYTILNHLAHGYSDWWAFYEATDCDLFTPCMRPFPAGWGGAITDSYVQGCVGQQGNWDEFSEGAFREDLCGLGMNYGLKTGTITDPARWLSVVEVGVDDKIYTTSQIVYPDKCGVPCTSCDWAPTEVNPDCPWTQDCLAYGADYVLDSQYRKDHVKARHLGGVNLGFADGHAKWMSSEAIIAGSIDHPLRGTNSCCWGDYVLPKKSDPAIVGPAGLCYFRPFVR